MSETGPSASGSGGGKRPRGRPLKGTVDEGEAAIRRRARVRKAQQAFQKRKEAAVQDLEDRLSAVQNGLEEFGNQWSDFASAITQTGIADSHPDILRQLHNLTERLLALANTASPQSPMDADIAPSGPSRSGGGGSGGPPSGSEGPTPSSGAPSRSGSTLSTIRPGVEHLFLSDADFGGTGWYSSGEEQPGVPNTMQLAPSNSFLKLEPSFDLQADAHAFSSLWKSGIWYTEPRGVSGLTTSDKAASFTDNLFIKTVTVGFHDIHRTDQRWSDPTARAKFRYCLPSKSRDEMLLLLRLSADGFWHRFKAGETQGNLQAYFSRTVAALGLSARRNMLQARDNEDQYLNSGEVESYLRAKGGFYFGSETIRMSLPLPPTDFATAISTTADLQVDSPTRAMAAAQAILRTSATRCRETVPDNSLSQVRGFEAARSSESFSTKRLTPQGLEQAAEAMVTITLSVRGLIDRLVAISVCLGDGVGFRKAYINQAIVKSAIGISV